MIREAPEVSLPPKSPTSQDPYAPPNATLTEPGGGEPTKAELSAFVGPNATDYVKKWEGLRTGSARMAGFNWSAVFAGLLWFVYRRMYWEAAIWIGLTIVASFVEVVVTASFGIAETDPIAGLISSGSSLALPAAAGFAANPLYYRRARKAVFAWRRTAAHYRAVVTSRQTAAHYREGDSEPTASQLMSLANLGGVRPGAVWTGVGLVLALMFVAGMLAGP